MTQALTWPTCPSLILKNIFSFNDPITAKAASRVCKTWIVCKASNKAMTQALTWPTCPSSILKNIFSFNDPITAKAAPVVCKAWSKAMPKQEKTQALFSGPRVERITIFTSSNHSEDHEFVEHLAKLSSSDRITFLESREFEIPERYLYSLEELHSDNNRSLNSVIRLTLHNGQSRKFYLMEKMSPESHIQRVHINLMGSYLQLINELYLDPYFKKIVLGENFKKYNPHKFGLKKDIPWEYFHPALTIPYENTLKALQQLFRKLDEELPTIPAAQKKDFLSKKTFDTMKLCELLGNDFSVLFLIAEYSAVAKTILINKASKDAAPFNEAALFDIFYAKPIIEGDLEGLVKPSGTRYARALYKTFNGIHRSNFMAHKVIVTLAKLQGKGVDLKKYSIYIYVGRDHFQILNDKLSAHALCPIIVKNPVLESIPVKVPHVATKKIKGKERKDKGAKI